MNRKTIVLGCLTALFVFGWACNTGIPKEQLDTKLTLEVAVGDMLRSFSGNTDDPAFLKSINYANQVLSDSQASFIPIFAEAFEKNAPGDGLASLFSGGGKLAEKISSVSGREEVLAALEDELDARMEGTISILRARVDRFGIRHHVIQRIGESERILVELPELENPKRMKMLLTARAEFSFWETYGNAEIFPYLGQANERIKEIEAAREQPTPADSTNDSEDNESDMNEKQYPLFSKLQPGVNSDGQLIMGPVVGIASSRDTAMVNSYLSYPRVKELFPGDLRFLWDAKSPGYIPSGSHYELYAIKMTKENGSPILKGEVITSAKAEIGYDETPMVSMKMNNEGAKKWARLTKENIGRHLAIVLDNSVYTAPRVNAEITGGRCQLSGDFTLSVAQDLANIIQASALPLSVRLVEEHVIN